jgi:Zn finger protein HypA/HybF involved in hydrogenase expression
MTLLTKYLPSILGTLAAIVVVVFLVIAIFPLRGNIVQPIAYNHKIHVEEAELECTDCHVYVEELASATIPSIEICQDCHGDEPISESPEEEKLLQYIEEEREIPWKRIYEVPDHVYFSHRRHVVIGELECRECHGNMPELTAPAPNQFLRLTMDNCMDCHKQHKVTNDCLACHR